MSTYTITIKQKAFNILKICTVHTIAIFFLQNFAIHSLSCLMAVPIPDYNVLMSKISVMCALD